MSTNIKPLEIIKKQTSNTLRKLKSMPDIKLEYFDGFQWTYVATEDYVNRLITASCMAATTGLDLGATYYNGPNNDGVGATLTSDVAGELIVDGLDSSTLIVHSRVLVKDQTVSAQNGIYEITNNGSSSTQWILTRTSDYNSMYSIAPGDIVGVSGGQTNAVTAWMQVAPSPTVGTGNITFLLLASGQGSVVIEGTANEIDVVTNNHVSTVSIASNPTIPGQGGMILPQGDSTTRPSLPTSGTLRFNTNPT